MTQIFFLFIQNFIQTHSLIPVVEFYQIWNSSNEPFLAEAPL